MLSAIDAHGRTIFVADEHRGDGKRFVVHPYKKLIAFMELESAIRRSEIRTLVFPLFPPSRKVFIQWLNNVGTGVIIQP
jgi:hypothetical protein